MLQSKLFTKTRKEAPKDEVSLNAKLLTRAGFVFKEMAGVYSYLPLGFRVLKKIEQVIREEMNAIGGLEMKTSILQSKEVWEKSNRWDDNVVDNWFKAKLKNGTEVGLSFTNEEDYSNILKQYISSYKDLPVYPYDFKEIFRNEARSKSGIMRGREFYWKALYSFSKSQEDHESFYEEAKRAYEKIFERIGIGSITYLTFASGGTFSKFSHEFQTITEAGEDTIYIDEDKKMAVNKEIYNDEVINNLELNKEKLVEKKAVEVGNIFTLGTKFSQPFDLGYKNEEGKSQEIFMGSYGIGLGRVMGTVVEVLSDKDGMVWPEEIAPFKVHIIEIASSDGSGVKTQAEKIYSHLEKEGVEVLLDDRTDVSAGEKFADADLIGIPYRIVISDKTQKEGKLELKVRKTGEVKNITEQELFELVK